MTNTKTKKTVTKKPRVTKKSVTNKEKTVQVSLLLPRHMFDTDRAQLIVSLLMLAILIIQVYLFVNVYTLLGQIAELSSI